MFYTEEFADWENKHPQNDGPNENNCSNEMWQLDVFLEA